MHIPFIETSAKTNSKVTEAFSALVVEMQRSSDPENSGSIRVDVPGNQPPKQGCC